MYSHWVPSIREERRECRLKSFWVDEKPPPKVLLLIPGHGQNLRWKFLSHTLNTFADEWRHAFLRNIENANKSKKLQRSKTSSSGDTSSSSTQISDDLFLNLGCVIWLYKAHADYNVWDYTWRDRMLGNFTATHCEFRRRIRFNWTSFLKATASKPDPAVVEPGQFNNNVKAANATFVLNRVSRKMGRCLDREAVLLEKKKSESKTFNDTDETTSWDVKVLRRTNIDFNYKKNQLRILESSKEDECEEILSGGTSGGGVQKSSLSYDGIQRNELQCWNSKLRRNLALSSNYDYIIMILDDMYVTQFDIREYSQILQAFRY